MQPFHTALWPCIVGMLALCASEFARASDGARAAQTGEVASSTIGGAQLADILDDALAMQRRYREVGASLEIAFEVNLAALASDGISVQPYLARDNGRCVGAVTWMRDLPYEQVGYQFDRAVEFRVQEYMDRTIVEDGARQLAIYPQSKQALIRPAGPLATVFAPSDFLLPHLGSDFDELRSSGATITVERIDDDRVSVAISQPGGGGMGGVVGSGTLDRRFGWAVTQWTCDACRRSVEIEYGVSASGDVIPTSARMQVFARDGTTALRTVRLIVKDIAFGRAIPANERIARPPAGYIVADYASLDAKGKHRVYELDNSGAPRALTAIQSATQSTILATNAAIGAIVLIAIGFRLRLLARKQRLGEFVRS